MPVSKNRRKDGKRVKNNNRKRAQRIEKTAEDQPSGVSLQDLINVLAYQEYEKRGELPSQQTDPETEDPRPCKGENSNVCVAEGCYGEACTHIQEER